MPLDPITLAISAAGMGLDFFKGQQAKGAAREAASAARESEAFQRANLAQAMGEARGGRAGATRAAGGLRLDQFGNATYYDPNQGRWITSFSPLQQELINRGQERQYRAQTRGTQASQDYDRLRAEYLYRRPKTEEESYAEILNLINQARGTGEQQLNTLMNRWGVRTGGNLPQLVQRDRGPTPGQELAETMLRARGSALDESLKREQGHTGRYLPALKQFEETANYVAPVDPTGSGIIGMQETGRKELLGTMSDYDKLLATLAVSGGRNVAGAASDVTKALGDVSRAQMTGPGSSEFFKLAALMAPEKEKAVAGTLGGTKGARSGGGGSIATYKGPMDALANQMSYGVTRGYGGNRSYLTPSTTSRLIGGEPSPIGLGEPGGYGELGDDIAAPSYWGQGGGVPYSGISLGTPDIWSPYENAPQFESWFPQTKFKSTFG